MNEPAAVLRNVAEAGHWLGVELVGAGNADVVGARAVLEVGGRKLTQFAKGGGSYASSGDRRLHLRAGGGHEAGAADGHLARRQGAALGRADGRPLPRPRPGPGEGTALHPGEEVSWSPGAPGPQSLGGMSGALSTCFGMGMSACFGTMTIVSFLNSLRNALSTGRESDDTTTGP